jgi:lysophospholipase L1-like esterase
MNFWKDKAGEKGGTLAEYAAMVVKVAEEMDVDVLDNFKELGITEKNWLQYLPDGTHPNERARYLFGSRIIEKIEFEEKRK